jgi:hypothetical protein
MGKFKMTYLTKQQIVAEIVSQMTEEDKNEFKTLHRDEMFKFHNHVGRYIRNTYGLWNRDNPLTALWFIDEESGNEEYIRGGIDYHPCHPDHVSTEILEAVWDDIQDPLSLAITEEDIEKERTRG